MARNFLTAINLNKNELQNPLAHNLAAAPSGPAKGQFYMNTSDNTLYYWDGTIWQSAKGGTVTFPGFGSVTQESTFGATKNDGAATTAARADHTHGNPTHVNADHAAINLSALAAPTTDLSIGGFRLVNVGNPTATTDGANKGYVDGLINGMSWKAPVEVATTANVALTGLQTIDGVAAGAAAVLVKNQTAPAENGIYMMAAGAWTRRSDMDQNTEFPSAAVYVKQGSTQADTQWVCTNDPPPNLGSTPITWVQTSGPGAITAGAGLSATGNTINVGANADASITVNADDIQVAANGVTNVKLADMATMTLKGNNTGATADPIDLTVAQVKTMLSVLRTVVTTCAAALSTPIVHNWGTRNVSVTVYRTASPYDEVDCDVEHTDLNTVTVRFSVAPALSDYTILVIG